MANTYTQIHIQTIFCVKNRLSLIHQNWKNELYLYVTGIIENHNHKVLAINGMNDHIHILFGMRPSQALSDLVQEIKSSSSKWINNKGFVKGRFEWQSGFGAFSYSKSQIPNVIAYIENQELHHQKLSFMEEYKAFLEKFGVDFKEEYIFKELD
jgi:REP element-mobilizing transposase RayT